MLDAAYNDIEPRTSLWHEKKQGCYAGLQNKRGQNGTAINCGPVSRDRDSNAQKNYDAADTHQCLHSVLPRKFSNPLPGIL